MYSVSQTLTATRRQLRSWRALIFTISYRRGYASFRRTWSLITVHRVSYYIPCSHHERADLLVKSILAARAVVLLCRPSDGWNTPPPADNLSGRTTLGGPCRPGEPNRNGCYGAQLQDMQVPSMQHAP